jgi:hypothetical protein
MTMTGTEQNEPTVAELLARIEELEGRLIRRRGPRRYLPRRLAIMLGLVLTLVFGPTFASLADAKSPASSFWSFVGDSITTGQFLGTTNPEPLVMKTNGITALTIGAGSGSTPGNVAVAGKLNAAGGLQEGGTDLSSKYAVVGGSNATGTWPIGISGNAGTVTHGLYDNGSYSDPAWLTSLAGSKITGNISGKAAGFTGSLSGDVTGGQSSTVVGALHGTALSSAAPTGGQVLTYNSTDGKWEPKAVSSSLSTQIVSSVHSVACCAGHFQDFHQACPSGYSVVGGGFIAGDTAQHVWGSFPSDSSTWQVRMTDDLGPHNMEIFADCVQFSP